MAITNPIKYTSRTFASILADINSDTTLTDKPNWFKRIWAGIGDVLSMWLNSMINLIFLRTSYTRNSVSDLLGLIDYSLSAHSTGSGYCLFFVDSTLGTGIFPVNVLQTDLTARSSGSLLVSSKRFEARAGVTISLKIDTRPSANFNTTSDIITMATETTFVRYTGHKVRISTDGTMPSPFAVDTDYFVIRVSATQIRLATSLANANAGLYVDIGTQGSGNHTLTYYSESVSVYQQTTISSAISVGVSDSSTEWQEFDLPDTFVLGATLSVTINGLSWTAVTTFVNSISTNKHYKLIAKGSNKFSIRFGNGIYGKIPPAFDIMVDYAYGGGADSNLSVIDSVNSYAGSNVYIKGVSNVTAMTGGADEEGISTAKIIAPMLLKARDRFVTEADGEALAKAYGGLSQVNVIKNAYGLLSCKVVGIATGGGNPSSALKTAIQSYLIERSILDSIDVRFVDCTITPVAVTSDVHPKPGYLFANIYKYLQLAWQLFLTETGQEISDAYVNNGIESAVTMINSVFTASFTSADYIEIEKLLDNFEPRQFGDVITESDIFSFIQSNVAGIDYMTITTFGTGLPMISDDYEITTVGTLTLGEI